MAVTLIFLLLLAIVTVSGLCKFDEHKRKLFTGKIGETHKASGPKCKYLCDLNPKCQSATVRMIRGQGMVCEIMYDAPGDISALDDDPEVVLYVKKAIALSMPSSPQQTPTASPILPPTSSSPTPSTSSLEIPTSSELTSLGTPLSIISATEQVTESESCPNGYNRSLGHCYLWVTDLKYFGHAKSFCETSHTGAYLAAIGSQEENDYVNKTSGGLTWLGGKKSSGTWAWLGTGESLTNGYENWHTDEPDGSGVCLRMDDGVWKDTDCFTEMPSVCEYEQA